MTRPRAGAAGFNIHSGYVPQRGHVRPVIFSWHLGIALNDVAGAAKGALDPQEFWHAWARGEKMKVDLFDPNWDFWAATREPIETVRQRIGVAA